MNRKPSPELERRVDLLDGCRGSWYLDTRDNDYRGYDLHALPAMGCRTPAEALAECVAQRWQHCRLLFSPAHLNGDSGYGYTAPSYYVSNERTFRDCYAKELENADGDGDGIALDVRYITAEMIEAIVSLENYPILDEDDHSRLELDLQQEEWESWAQSDWRSAVEKALAEYAPDAADDYWAEETLDAVPDADAKLAELFHACSDCAGEYWEEQSDGDYWIRIDRIAEKIDRADLAELTGLALLAPDQEWRREPYPWPGADPSPLAPALELTNA